MEPKRIKIKPDYIVIQPRRLTPIPKPDKDWAYIAGAMALSPNAYRHLDHEFEGVVQHLPATGAPINCLILPPDVVAHRKISKQTLSTEACYVLELILNTPTEILQLVTTPIRDTISLPRIARYLRNFMGWETRKVSQTFSEIQNYVVNL